MRALVVVFVVMVAALAGCNRAEEIDLDDEAAAPTTTARDGGGSRGGGGSGGGAGGGGAAPLDDTGPVGTLGRALLTDDVPQAVVEIDSASDTALSEGAVQGLVDALAEHGRKDASPVRAGPPLPSQDVYTADDLRRISHEHRDNSSGGDSVAVHVLVLPGEFEDSSATGVAFEAGSFAIFVERLHGSLVRIGSPERFETAVAVHELGHLFGLVNLTGDGGFHEDPEHPGHSSSRDSVMYWAVEDVSVGNVFRGGPPTTFDDADRREMANLRR